MAITNQRWNEEEFQRERKRVLGLWPTGKDVDLQEALELHQGLPAEKNFAKAVVKAKSEGKTLVQPRGGVALVEEHIKLLRCLQDQGGAELLPTTTDTYTRNLRFNEAQRGIEASLRARRSMLNGLPVVNHGVENVKKVIHAVDRPVMILSGTAFPRLTAEVALAAGFTGFLGAGISYTTSYTKDLTIEEGIRNYQYLDRLVSFYADHGIPIHREQPGFLTGTLIPPGIGIAIAVMEALLAAGQGLRHFSVGLCQNLDFLQDVAALRVLEEVCRDYLDRFGYEDMFISIASHQWMQAFPPDEARAFSVIALGGAIAALAGATQVITKTTHESAGIPTMAANAEGVRATRMAIKMVRDRRMPLDADTKTEMNIIRAEACAILDKTLEMGDGDIALGAVRGFEAGVIDVPWAPNANVRGEVIPIRDAQGAVRYLDFGNLPFNREIIEYHKERLRTREERDGRKMDYETALFDITEISQAY